MSEVLVLAVKTTSPAGYGFEDEALFDVPCKEELVSVDLTLAEYLGEAQE
jgi:hypothetical protein